MADDFSLYDDVEALERYINVPVGALKNIPIYARVPAVQAILAVREMEKTTIFRPGLYYIVLADLMKNTEFNAKYGDKDADTRVEWFQTCAITALGSAPPSNFATYLKPIGDAALLIFSSFTDVVRWSARFTSALDMMSDEFIELCDADDDNFESKIEDFKLHARRLVHVGEVRFKESSDPICLAVSQVFKAEKLFELEDLGCTEAVLTAVQPLLSELGLVAIENVPVELPGHSRETQTYYLQTK